MRLLILLIALLVGASAWSKDSYKAPSERPDWTEFQHFCRLHRSATEGDYLPRKPSESTLYVPIGVIEGSQSRFSFKRFLDTMAKDLTKGDDPPHFSRKFGHWVFPYDDGRSFYPLRKALQGYFYRGKIYLDDGHHRALISLYTGADTVPVHILPSKWAEQLSPKQFHAEMERRGLSRFRNFRGEPMKSRDLCEMVDDPNLMLARYLMRKVEVSFENGQLQVELKGGSHMPIAIKISNDIPYWEYELADPLHRAGVRFDDRRDDRDMGYKERRTYLEILQRAARRNPHSRLNEILFLDEPTPVDELKVKKLVLEHLERHSCERLLKKK